MDFTHFICPETGTPLGERDGALVGGARAGTRSAGVSRDS